MKQLLKHFKALTLHPKNAEELKGLILKLAVQGNLTAQWRKENPDGVPASVLLDKIASEKAMLIKEKKIKKEKPFSPITEESIPYELPKNWSWIQLGDLMAMYNGRAFKKDEWASSGLPIIRIQNLNKAHASFNYYQGDLEDRHRILPGTFLISWSGTPGTSFGAFIWEGAEGALNQHINKCEFFYDGVDFDFYKKSINSQLYKLIEQAQGGAGLKHVTKGILNNLVLPLPPLKEQKAIVATVNQLFAEVEQLEDLTKQRIQLKEDFVTSALRQLSTQDSTSAWSFLHAHFKSFFTEKSSVATLRESILQLAVQGRLTKHWRVRHPELVSGSNNASNLLAKIKAEKEALIKAKTIKKEKTLPAITKEEIPYELPEGWVWCRITDLTNVGTGSTPSKTNSSYYGGEIPWYTSSATNDDFAKVQDVMITQKALDETNCKVFPEGSLIIAMYGQGKTRGQISELITPGATNQAIAAMVFFESSRITKQYLKYYFQKFYHEIRLLAEGGAQPNLNVGKVKATLIPLPPIKELDAIVQKVNALMALCDTLEAAIETHQTTQEHWMKSCLKAVFEE